MIGSALIQEKAMLPFRVTKPPPPYCHPNHKKSMKKRSPRNRAFHTKIYRNQKFPKTCASKKAATLGKAKKVASQRGSSLTPISASSTARAACRPSRIAQTTRLCPRRISPQAKICGSLVW